MAKEELDSLMQKANAFEKKYIAQAPDEERQEWASIKTGLQGIINAQEAPAVKLEIKLPTVLVVTPEIVELPKNMGNLANVITTGDGGGLADISAALVAELYRQGVNVKVALPEFKNLFMSASHITSKEYEQLKIIEEKRRIYLISDGILSGAERVYNDQKPLLDKIDLRRANAFMRGVIYRVLPDMINGDVVVHCNDWMTGLIPAAVKNVSEVHGKNMKSLMTFHNIFTQHQWPKGLQKHGINIEPFWDKLYYRHHPEKSPGVAGTFEDNYETNEVDFLTSGLHAADYINTVSPTFLKEIVNWYFQDAGIIPDYMREVIIQRNNEGRAKGILNAPVISADPSKDSALEMNYWHDTSIGLPSIKEGKKINKAEFQKQMGLKQDPNKAIFFWPSRIAEPQKQFKMLMEIFPYLATEFNMQLAIVANGDQALIEQAKGYEHDFPGILSYSTFTRKLSQLGKAASDFLLMPSLYEPCGTPQVEGPRYGTLPVVRRTGGLADTVEHLSTNGLIGNGFVYDDCVDSALWYGIAEAMNFHHKPEEFKQGVLTRTMKESFERFNIQNTAKAYIEVYQEMLGKKII